jgi:hypothetical protein
VNVLEEDHCRAIVLEARLFLADVCKRFVAFLSFLLCFHDKKTTLRQEAPRARAVNILKMLF